MAERDGHTDATTGPGGGDIPPAGDDYTPQQEGDDVSRWTFGRVVGYTLGGLLAFVVTVLAVVVLLLQTPWGAEQAKKRVMVPLVNNALQEGAELEVDRLDGTFVTNLRFYDAAIVDSTGQPLLVTDTASVDFNLLGLLRGRLAINDVALADPAASMHQRADGTWDLLDIFIAPEDTIGPRLNLHLDYFATTNGYLEMHFYPPSSDSVLVADNLDIRFSELRVDERLHVRLDTLTGRYILPGTTDSVHVAAGGRLAHRHLTVDQLFLQSPNSSVRTTGTLVLPSDTTTYIEDIDFELHADPLAFRDIHPFFPRLNPEAVVTLDAQLGGTTRALHIDAEGTTGDGATLTVDGTVTPGAEGPLTYQLDAQVQRLDPDYFTAQASEERTLLTGEISVDLAGTDLAALTGTFDASLSGSRIAALDVREADLEGTVEEGAADVSLRALLPGGSFTAEGSGRFFDEVPTYRVDRGRFENLDIAAFTGDPEQQSDLTGTFTAQGRGTSLEEMQLDATLDLAPSSYGTYDIRGVEAQLNLADERLTFDADARLQGGRFDMSGTYNMQGQVPSYRAEGQFYNVHLGELTNDPQQESDLTGRLTLRGTGTDPETATITADLRLRNSTLNGQPIEHGTADLTLRSGNLRFDVDFATPGGSFAALGTARFRGEVVTYRIEEGSFENLDIATFTGDTTQTSNLTGTFTAQGRGTELATLTLDAQVDLEESVYNQQQIDQATLSIALARGQLDLVADVQTPEGGFRIRGGGDLLADQPTFALQEGTFRNVDVGAWINVPNFSTSLNGRIMFEGAGTSLEAGALDATVELDTSRVNQALLVDGRLSVQLEGGALEASGQLDFADGRAVFDADALFAGEAPDGGLRRYSLQADLNRIDVGALTGVDTLAARASLTVDLSGRGTDPETMELQASVTGSEIVYQDADVQQLRLQAAVNEGVVRVDTLVLDANFADVTAGGRIALWSPRVASDFRFQADVQNLAPIRPFLDVQQFAVNDGYLEGRVYGTRNTLRITAGGRVSTLVYDEIRVAGFDGRVNVALDTLQQIDRGDVRAEVNYFSVPAITIQQAELQARYDGDEVTFEGDVRVDARREAQFAGVADLRPGRERLQIDELNLHFDDEHWELLQPATVTYAEEYRVSGFLLYSDDQQIAIDGVIDPDGRQNLVLTVENVEIDPITDLLQYDGLGGTVTGSIDLTGPATAPNLNGVLMADLRSFDEPVGTLRLGVDYDSLRLNLDALLTHRDGSTLSGEGYVVYDFSLAPREGAEQGVRLQTQQVSEGAINFTARTDSFAIDWVQPFLDPETVRRIDGRLTGEVLIGGTVDAPDLQGEARLSNGRMDLPQLGLAYTDIHAEALFENDRIRLQQARMRSGGGRLTAEGTINVQELTSASFNLRARAHDFLAIDTRDIRAVTSADVRMTGSTREPVVRGDVRVLSANYYLEENAGGGDLQSVTLEEQDVQMLERYFGMRPTEGDTTTFDFYEASTIELDVELERDTWVRARSNPELNIQLTGDVDFAKLPYEPEQVFGTIEVIESRSFIKQLGRRFDITSGVLRFNGDPANPAIDAAAEYEVKSKNSTGSAQVVITLAIEGRLQNPDITLGSDPPMENVDIISYIATGQPAGRGLGLGGGNEGLLGRGGNLAISQVAGLVEGMAAENLGLDVVEIQHQGLNEITLTLGKYVTPRLYAAVRQPLSNLSQETEQGLGTGTEFTLEYELLEWLLGRATQRNNTLRLDLFWEYSY